MPRWISEAGIRVLHGELLAEHGGLTGSTNEDMLGATLARPQQLEAYGNPAPTIFDLAAAYGFGFAKNHCFNDGNKRVALMAIYVFLDLNNYSLVADQADAVYTIEGLAASSISEDDLSAWIESNVLELHSI